MTTPALDRLRAGYYNSRPKTNANPGGLASNGHVTSFPDALVDIATGVDEAVEALDATTAAALAAADATLDAKVEAAQAVLDDTITARNATTAARDDTQELLEAANAAALAAAGSAGQAAGFSATSTSELTIGTGEKTLDVGPGKRFGDVLFVSLKDTAAPNDNWMHGSVVSYAGSTLTVLVTSTAGAGTKSSWQVANSGPVGPSMSSGPLTGAVNEKAATVASHPNTADIWGATGNVINFTGAATVTAFPAAPQAGSGRQLICAAGITFVPSADLIVPGGLPYITLANDRVRVLAVTITRFLLAIDRANGLSVIEPSAVGDLLLTERNPGAHYLLARSTVLAQASYPALFSVLGLRGNNLSAGFGSPGSWSASTNTYNRATGPDGYGYFYFWTGNYLAWNAFAPGETNYYSATSEWLIDFLVTPSGDHVQLSQDGSGTGRISTSLAGTPMSRTLRASGFPLQFEASARISRVNGVYICFALGVVGAGTAPITILTSPDAQAWTTRNTAGLRVTAYGAGSLIWFYAGTYYIQIGNEVFFSTDLATWTKTTAANYVSSYLKAVHLGDYVFTLSGGILQRLRADLSGAVTATTLTSPAGLSAQVLLAAYNELYVVGSVGGDDAIHMAKLDPKTLRHMGAVRSPDGGGAAPFVMAGVASETANTLRIIHTNNGGYRWASHQLITYNPATQFAVPDYSAMSAPAYIKVQ